MYLHNAQACQDYKPRKENTADAERDGRVGTNLPKIAPLETIIQVEKDFEQISWLHGPVTVRIYSCLEGS